MQRENVLVGLSSPRGPSSDEIDFNDVFGGPPRRFSMQEVRVRYSFGDLKEPEEDRARSSSWEKPVFGEDSRPRRGQQGDDFFDDIFTGSKETDRDNVFGPGPGSRIMSPVRPSFPKAEPLSSSLPTQFSLPSKLIKATNLSPFGSNNQYKKLGQTNALNSPLSSSPSSRFSSQSINGQDHKARRNGVDHLQSPLSRQDSFSSHDSPRAENDADSFHFSIYKWAGMGVPMLLPGFVAGNSLKSKKGNGSSDDITTIAAGMEHKPFKMDVETEELRSRGSSIQESLYQIPQTKSGASVNVFLEGENSVEKKVEKQVLLMKERASKNEVKPLRAFVLSDEIEQNPDNILDTKEEKDRTPKGVDAKSHDGKHAKKHEKRTKSNKAKVNKSDLQGAAVNSGKRVSKGKVKEFVQIFNQNETHFNAAKAKESVMEYKKSDVSLKVDENLNNQGSQDHPSNPVSTNQKKIISSESIHKESKIAPEYLDDPLEDNFLVQELSDDHERAAQDEGSEDIKAMDAKIQQWSLGKKGNIRSLLSTLQYVLWSDSGWKPVPLVDLIETNSVKKAYQKALLRLHPDKLQQKGAAFHQKYIAEKVFDILQEAWDHFDSCSSLNF